MMPCSLFSLLGKNNREGTYLPAGTETQMQTGAGTLQEELGAWA